MKEEPTESVVCGCGERSILFKSDFREVAEKKKLHFTCPKCSKNLDNLIHMLQKGVDRE
jgi:hypothetical protein